jgi:hypothetical protein
MVGILFLEEVLEEGGGRICLKVNKFKICLELRVP